MEVKITQTSIVQKPYRETSFYNDILKYISPVHQKKKNEEIYNIKKCMKNIICIITSNYAILIILSNIT